ncbi:MAG TPA: hypothetical protein VFS43_22895 [Polyangiaceae bacterium]|nr:hypothetical protein [Polyangiaceae bacterium]
MTPDAPGQAPGQGPPAGFSWGDYVAWLVERQGSLAAVAERLAALSAYADDVGSVERGLRRLRARGQLGGGRWGAKALAAFGLPDALDERARWMGAYHSRFTDLPLPLCQDLLRLWDRPPLSDSPSSVWLALGHATCALRGDEREGAQAHLRRARASFGRAPPAARVELLLAEAFVASRVERERVPALLAEAEPWLGLAMPADDRACLHARWVDQRAYELNHRRGGRPPDHAAAEALYAGIPTEGAPAFALCRRASGLAFAHWKRGDVEGGAALAREACRHAGDGGHLRLRAMALTMLGRIVGGEEGAAARARAVAIAASLDDEALRLRFRAGRPGQRPDGPAGAC